MTIPVELARDLEALYVQFEPYRPRGLLEHSPLKSPTIAAALKSKPLRDLSADDFKGYSGSAVWTVGTANDFKYFFPRMAELALHEIVGASGWDSWAFRLVPALATANEASAVSSFFRTLWETALASYQEVVHVDTLELLHALTYVFADIREFLLVFEPCINRAAALHLRDICADGPRQGVAESETPLQIATWFQGTAHRVLADSVSRFPPLDTDEVGWCDVAFQNLGARAR